MINKYMIHWLEIVCKKTEMDRQEHFKYQVLNSCSLAVSLLLVCFFCSMQNLCVLFIFRTLFHHIDDLETERKAGYTYMLFIEISCLR